MNNTDIFEFQLWHIVSLTWFNIVSVNENDRKSICCHILSPRF